MDERELDAAEREIRRQQKRIEELIGMIIKLRSAIREVMPNQTPECTETLLRALEATGPTR